MQLAIFDLDNTLLGGDSDYLWGRYLISRGAVEHSEYESANERFMREYEQGQLDIERFLAFSLRPLANTPHKVLLEWRKDFIREHIQPTVLPAAKALVEQHRASGHGLMIITATNRFVTEPIAELFNIPILLATAPEFVDGAFTGNYVGIPTFQQGKVQALQQWLDEEGQMTTAMHFYSDSHNDLPLLEHVDHPVAVDPDPQLTIAARERNWPIITLREGSAPTALT